MPAPVGAQALHHDPEQPVVPAHAGPPTGAQRHRELLPQEQVLQQQRAAITERPAEDAGEERHASEHEAMIADHVVCRVSAPRMEFSRPTGFAGRRSGHSAGRRRAGAWPPRRIGDRHRSVPAVPRESAPAAANLGGWLPAPRLPLPGELLLLPGEVDGGVEALGVLHRPDLLADHEVVLVRRKRRTPGGDRSGMIATAQ